MPFEPISPLGGFTGLAEPEAPQLFSDVNTETRGITPPDPGIMEAAFRTENTVGSSASSQEVRAARDIQGIFGGPVKIDPDFDPWAEISGTVYEPYSEQLAIAGNRQHFDAIVADINRQKKDRDTLAKSPWSAFGASAAAGVLDLPTLLPGGAIIKSAKGGVSLLRTAGATAVAGGVAGTASEMALQSTQQLRTHEESAMVIGGSVVLSGLLGAGFGKLMSRGEQAALAKRIESDFYVPGHGEPDSYTPGGVDVSAAPGASPRAVAVADAIRQTAEEILPPQVRVQVADKIDLASGSGKYAISAYHGSPHDFDEFKLDKIGTGEGAQAYGHGLYFAENQNVAREYQQALSKPMLDGNDIDDQMLATYVRVRHEGGDAALEKSRQTKMEHIASLEAARQRTTNEPNTMATIDQMLIDAKGELAKIDQVAKGKVGVRGNLYQTELDVNHEDLLDWDLPISQQSPKVKAAVEKIAETHPNPFRSSEIKGWLDPEADFMTGARLRDTLRGDFGSDADLTQALREAGIPGIRYLDQGSRGAGAGSRNIVIFDDKLVKITHKDGTPVTAAERKAIIDDMMSLRKAEGEPSAPVAEGRYDPEANLITIAADALDPAKTLRHESIHALKQMGLFTDKEWGTLEKAAAKGKWVESHNVRGLYEELYFGRSSGDQFSVRDVVNKELAEIYDEFSVSNIDELRALKKQLPLDEKRIARLGDELDRMDEAEVDRLLAEQYGERWAEDHPNGLPVPIYDSPPAMKSIEDEIQSILTKYKTEDAEYLKYLADELGGKLRKAEKFHTKASKYSVRGGGEAASGPIDPKLESLLTEEAIAEQFSLWRQGASKVTGTIAKLFERIQQFLDRIGNALRGQGFQTADDVFAAVRGGEVAGRAGPMPGLPGGAMSAAVGGGLGGGHGTSVGAAARDAVDNTLESALGLEKLRIDPLIYLQNSKSEKARAYVQELAETPLAYKKNAQGFETAPLGSEMGEPGAVESRIKGWQAPLAESVKNLENAFMRYRKGRDKLPFDQLRLTIGDAISKPEKLTWPQFKEEVAKAARRGDAHEIPEVAEPAKFARANVFDPLKDRAIDKALLPEDISASTAESYLNRMYNKEKIIARRPEFKQAITQWLDEVEFRNSVTRGQLAPLLKRLDELQGEAKAAKPKAGAKKAPVDPAEAEKAAEKAAADKAEMAELQQRIEDLVVKYEGKTKAEAESAIRAREKAEAGRDPDAKRLTAADKPIIRAAKKIAQQVDKEPGETASLADEIIDRILGTPDGRLPYDAHLNRTTDSNGVTTSVRGPLAARTFMIPDERIEDFLENDFEMLMHAYVRTMAPDVELHARFGDMDMKLQMKEIQDDWARKAGGATSEKERRSLHAQRNGDIKRLAAIRDRLRGTYALPSDPDGLLLRTGRVMRSLNYMAMLGGQVTSAIPDMGSIVFSHGIMRTFGDGIIPLFRNFSGTRLAAREVKLAGTALDMVLDSRAMNIGEIMDDYGRHTKFERGVQSLTRNFGPVSLMSPWNAAMKQTAGLITITRIIRASDALARGVIKKPDLARLAASGISEKNAKTIAAQFKKHGSKEGGVWLPNTENWDADARPAKEAFRVALVREVDKTIITPGQEKFLWMSSELGKTIGQFKSFSVSANQRLLIAGLQARDMGTLSGAALMVSLGGLVHILKTKASGREPEIDWGDKEKTSQFMVNAVDRSGLLGWLMEANNVTEKVTGGKVGLSAVTGRPVSRYASRNFVGALAGPTFGTLQSIGQVSSAGFTEWKETDTRAARRLIPYQNLLYLRTLFDKAETGVNEYFNVPKTATRH